MPTSPRRRTPLPPHPAASPNRVGNSCRHSGPFDPSFRRKPESDLRRAPAHWPDPRGRRPLSKNRPQNPVLTIPDLGGIVFANAW